MAVKQQVITDDYCLYNGDCVEVLKDLPDGSVGFSVSSPPFTSLYKYSDDPADMSNASTRKEFFEHYGFMVEQLYRVMMSGRVVAVHCMDLPTHKQDGEEIGAWDFPGRIVRCYEQNGFSYQGRVTIWKDPLLAAVRTHAIGLAHQQIVKDSAMCRAGFPDILLVFRKPGDNPKPVRHPEGLTEYYGTRDVPKELNRYLGHREPATNKRSHWIWQQYASPVWFDIDQTKVLPYREAKENEDEKHICPLQLDVVERCMALWTAEGDVVLTPFMGVGTEVYVAVKNGRKGVGAELKTSYYQQAVRNLESLKRKQSAAKGYFTT